MRRVVNTEQQMPYQLTPGTSGLGFVGSNIPGRDGGVPRDSNRTTHSRGARQGLEKPRENYKTHVSAKNATRVSHVERRALREKWVRDQRAAKARRQPTSSRYVGRAAELPVCFDFVSRGYEAVVNDFPGAPTDVFAWVEGELVKIQVKGTQAPMLLVRRNRFRLKHKRTEYLQTVRKYRFGLRGVADLFAFVALDLRTVLYLPANQIGKGDKKFFGAATFAERAEGSLDRFLAERFLF
jgi:hypothetical protein